MFVDLDWPLNASSLLSASAELLVTNVHFNWSTKGKCPYVKLLLSKILTNNEYCKISRNFLTLKNSVTFLFKVSMNISGILDNTYDSFPSVGYFQCNHHHHHHHQFWLASLTVRSATHSQQPPEWSVLSHVASTWWGFTTADDRQWLEAVIRRGIRSGFCSADQSPLSQLVEAAADDHFLNNNLCNKEHVLNSVLPSIQLIYGAPQQDLW